MEAGSLPSLEKGDGGFISEKVETINPIATHQKCGCCSFCPLHESLEHNRPTSLLPKHSSCVFKGDFAFVAAEHTGYLVDTFLSGYDGKMGIGSTAFH